MRVAQLIGEVHKLQSSFSCSKEMWFRLKNQYVWIFFILLVIISVFYLIYDTYYSSDDVYFHQQERLISHTVNRCKWDPSMPVFVNIKTQLGVNYDAGHWFHMAENIMVEHSILRKKDQLINNSIIFYNFDKSKSFFLLLYFESSLN